MLSLKAKYVLHSGRLIISDPGHILYNGFQIHRFCLVLMPTSTKILFV